MAFSATFNIGYLSPYVEDYLEDPLDLWSNPFEKGEVEAEHDTQEGFQYAKHVQGAIQG